MVDQTPVFLDHHATTPVDPRVLEQMVPHYLVGGNASSSGHSFGTQAAAAVERGREQVAALLRTSPENLVFTSGATEANNLAIKGVLSDRGRGRHLITTRAEHRAVLDPAKRLARSGVELTLLDVDEHGVVDPESVRAAIRPETALVSVMLVNNEVGSINPVARVAEVCRAAGVLLHCDAAQALPAIPVHPDELQVDLLSMSAHKAYGPQGLGALWVRRRPKVALEPLLHGGGQERHLRAGTLPTALIAGFGVACELVDAEREPEQQRLCELRDRLWTGLSGAIDGLVLNGHPVDRVGGNLNVSIPGVDGDALMTSLRRIAVSAGSACSSTNGQPSHVLRAMGRSTELARSSLRFGIGRSNTGDDIDVAVAEVTSVVRRLRA